MPKNQFLPEFDREELVIRNFRIGQPYNPRKNTDYFVRPTRINHPALYYRGKLSEHLKYASEQFAVLAEYCGAVVIDHTFGIVENPHDINLHCFMTNYTYTPPDIPSGYILAARVPVIKRQKRLNKKQTNNVVSGCAKYLNEFYGREEEGLFAYDAAKDFQFTFGTTKVQQNRQLLLHDIEPFLWRS